MRFFFTALLFIIGITLVSNLNPCSAQYYKYTNDKGVVIFTDDLSRVPVDKRPQIKSYTTYKSEQNNSTTSTNTIDQTIITESSSNRTASDLSYKNKRLELEKEKQSLDQEKEQLIKDQDSVGSHNEAKEYNKKVQLYNKKIELFKTKLKQFYSDVKP